MPTDDEVRAEVQAIINSGASEPTPIADPAGADATGDDTGEAQADAAAPAQPAAPQLDEQTSRKLALSRQAQLEAQRERQQLAAERQQHQAELAEMRAYRETMSRAKATRDPAALLRAHGIDPTREDAESLLVESMGKDAPADLRIHAQMAALRREQEAFKSQVEQQRREYEERAQQAEQARVEQQRREYVRSTLVPQFGDATAAIRALAGDPEDGDHVIGAAIERYRALSKEQGDIEPIEAFKQIHSKLIRTAVRLMSDPAAAKEIQAALAAAQPKLKPIPTAEKPQPAPTTISNKQHFGTTAPAASTKTFEEQVAATRAEMASLRQRGEL